MLIWVASTFKIVKRWTSSYSCKAQCRKWPDIHLYFACLCY